MKRKQFSEEHIIGILKEAEAGGVVTELCRKYGISSATGQSSVRPYVRVVDRVGSPYSVIRGLLGWAEPRRRAA